MTSSGRKIDVKTVEKYITALQQSFIIYEAKRYDVKSKKHLKLMEKYYDVGHILENIVYLELIRRGYKVFVGKVDDVEIDFVAQNYEGNLYIQVSATVRDKSTLKRELRPLQIVKDNYPKLLLTLDDDPTVDFNGIKQIDVLEWLLN